MAQIQQFKIKTDRLDNDIRNLEDKLRQVRQIRQELIREADQLNGMWEGEAKTAFMSQFRSDCSILEAREREFQKRIDRLKHASQEYQKCEARVGDEIRSLRIGRS